MIPAAQLTRAVAYENARFRDRVMARFSAPITRAVLANAEAVDLADYRAANEYIGATSRELNAAHLHRAYDEDLIRDYAENYARLCARANTLEKRCEFALAMGIEPPADRNMSPTGKAARLECPRWWRRQLRKAWTRSAENKMRELGFIRKGRAPYASDEAVRHRAAQKRRGREFLEGHVATNEEGEQLNLWEAREHSISNPALRRGEMMCRARGFQLIAEDMGHAAEFITITAPSAFHAQLAAGGANPKWQRHEVRAAQAWLCKLWAKIRAQLKRLSLLIYGFRVAEAHHDGTPHWHCLFFVPRHALDTLRAVISGHALREFADEQGARERRVVFEPIDPAKGSPVGYLAKYISKNIDGKGAIADERDNETGATVADGIARVDAWASIHGIRQFQQIGGPPVALWREARRLRDRVEDADIDTARQCADAGRWREFVQCVGGIHAGRRTNLKLLKVETGERDRYGDCKPARVIGLQWASAIVITRPHRWWIEKKGCCPVGRPREGARASERRSRAGPSSPVFSSLGPVSITVREASRVARAGPHYTPRVLQ